MIRPIPLYLFTLLVLFSASGATCLPWHRQPPLEPSPVLFQAPPSLAEVIQTVNANSQPIHQLQSQSVRLSVPGMPGVRGTLAVERPRHFRLKGEMFGSAVLDVGSNDEVFWIWNSSDADTTYFARHAEFANSRMRQVLPIEPAWLMEALGLVYLDPQGTYEGPVYGSDGRVELRMTIPSPSGPLTRSIVVHDRYGWILQQSLRDAQGTVLVTAEASRHRYYPEHQVSLPEEVEVVLAPGRAGQMRFRLDVGSYTINQLYQPPAELWTLPQRPGTKLVDITRMGPATSLAPRRGLFGLRQAPPAARQARTPPGYGDGEYRPEFRGYTREQR